MRARKSRFYQLFTLSKGAGAGIQGEFGIGLLSVRTVGGTLTMTPPGTDQRAYQMLMNKGEPRYTVSPRRVLFAERGTEVKISPLLEGIRGLSGEKIQWYLASELRDRIRNSQVRVYAELYLIEPADDCAGPKQTYSPCDPERGFGACPPDLSIRSNQA